MWIIRILIYIYLLRIGLAEEDIRFPDCPKISYGDYPFCVCKHGPAYDYPTNTCPNPECPVNESVGIYPNCTCQQKNFAYSITFNECLRVCPHNSTGYWPNCYCYSYEYDSFSNNNLFECIACPVESTGQYPDCKCENDGATFNIYNNECKDSIPCPYRSNDKYPNCTCEGNGIYNELTNICDECPHGSTGIYPNCICAEDFTYNPTNRSCVRCPRDATGLYPACTCNDENSTFNALNNRCYGSNPNESFQFPLDLLCGGGCDYDANEGCICEDDDGLLDIRLGIEDSVDWKVLRSSVG